MSCISCTLSSSWGSSTASRIRACLLDSWEAMEIVDIRFMCREPSVYPSSPKSDLSNSIGDCTYDTGGSMDCIECEDLVPASCRALEPPPGRDGPSSGTPRRERKGGCGRPASSWNV